MSFSNPDREWLSQIWYWDLQGALQGISQCQRVTLLVSFWSAFIISMMAFAMPSIYSTRLGSSVRIISGKNIVSRNIWPTVPFQAPWFTTNKTSDIVIFRKIPRNYFYQSSILSMRSSISCISNPFIYGCWSYLSLKA